MQGRLYLQLSEAKEEVKELRKTNHCVKSYLGFIDLDKIEKGGHEHIQDVIKFVLDSFYRQGLIPKPISCVIGKSVKGSMSRKIDIIWPETKDVLVTFISYDIADYANSHNVID